MAVSKRILGLAAASTLFVIAAPDAKAASTIKFVGSSAGVDFGAFDGAASVVANASCPGSKTGPCVSGSGTGIFSGYNAFQAFDGTGLTQALFIGLNSPNVAGGTPEFYGKSVTANVGGFEIIGGGSPIAVSGIGTFLGGGITQFNPADPNNRSSIPYWARAFEGTGNISLSGAFGTRSGTIQFKPLFGVFDSATGGNPTGFPEFSEIVITVQDPSSAVPAPLPLLGAGAAFGFSRKLRKRIKASAV